MSEEELKKYKQPTPKDFPVVFRDTRVSDEYGIYETGTFKFKGLLIFVNIEGGKWHLSASAPFPIGYYALKEVRYKFLPDGINAAQIFPPREEFVNLHENCYHLFEI